jgi:tetratricopeptide (TPR) repeat protein
MADKHVHEVEKNETVARVENFWGRNGKTLSYVLIGLIVVVGGWFAYQEMIVKPKDQKATDSIGKAQEYFAVDSFKTALNGDGQNKGFLYIINNYGGTKSANLAKYYAGVSYLKLGDFNNAVKYLKDFSSDAKQIQLMADGALGDAYSELNKNEDAISAYKKAGSEFEQDEFNSSEYLFRAALLSEKNGNSKQALELYKELKNKYPKTEKGFQADKYIYRLSIEPNDFTVK